ncbi:carbohydrate ABC transporter permease [Paenibacillus sp. Leaf72]|uniref:carbohydrate ABC transporter permease n=1 Tax=Paenibacillus sp. Leaf72 TaxID=1736234 RepID=UPI000701B2A9|nr:sugar ABC transporter permease [Paenibacillus sp. Leaf72]KQN97112.1 ABC transporter permease [Paenibacillus sp. Leaf72]
MAVRKTIYFFFVPGLLLYAVFFLYPTLSGFYNSFTDWDGMSDTSGFVGLDNYKTVADSIIFKKAIGNNLRFMLSVVVVQTLVSLIVALLLTKNKKTTVALRALYFFPTILSSAAVGFIAAYVYDPNLGLLNELLRMLGLSALANNWLGNPSLAIYSIAAVQAWAHIGQMAILFIAGLHAIPEELYEAAKLDGGGRWAIFRRITWPLLAPAATIVVAYTTIQSFKAFDLIFVTTRGGPNYATEILSTYIYSAAFQNYKFGQASAASIYFLFIIAFITFLQFKALQANRVSY